MIRLMRFSLAAAKKPSILTIISNIPATSNKYTMVGYVIDVRSATY